MIGAYDAQANIVHLNAPAAVIRGVTDAAPANDPASLQSLHGGMPPLPVAQGASIVRETTIPLREQAVIVTTVSTVGFGEVHPLSRAGRFFTMGLILFGVGALFYAFGSLTAFVFEGHLTHRWERRRMETRVERLSNHFVLCGYGRVGRQIARELKREGASFVVIDVNQASLDVAIADHHLVVKGNATDDEVLNRAGIDRARALITAIAEDAENIFVPLSARAMRPDLPIVARANYEDTIAKLSPAGATRVVSPYTMAGQQMAMLAVRPGAVDFVETLLRGSGGDLLLEDVEVAKSSQLCGVSIAQLRGQLTEELAPLAALREVEPAGHARRHRRIRWCLRGDRGEDQPRDEVGMVDRQPQRDPATARLRFHRVRRGGGAEGAQASRCRVGCCPRVKHPGGVRRIVR